MILPLLSFSALVFVMLRDVLSFRFRVALNPFFWLSLYTIFYFVIPSFFVEEISYYYSWGLTADSILYSNIAILLFCSLISSVYFFLPSSFNLSNLQYTFYQCGPLVKILWWLIFIYLGYALLKTYQSFDLLDAFQYDGKQADPYKVKNIAYILLTLTVLYFFNVKKYWVFIPNLIIIIIDLLNGSRTTAFIAISPVLICLFCHRQSLFLIPSLLLLVGMLFLGVIRSDNVVQQVPWYINALGEFRETYITLPLFITNEQYVGSGNVFQLIATVSLGLLQPLRQDLIEQFTSAGVDIYLYIGRGYGLGSNFITESLYYGYIAFFLMTLFLLVFLFSIYLVIQRSQFLPSALIIAVFSIVFVRIFIREGMPSGLGVMLFASLVYSIPLFYFNRFLFNKGM